MLVAVTKPYTPRPSMLSITTRTSLATCCAARHPCKCDFPPVHTCKCRFKLSAWSARLQLHLQSCRRNCSQVCRTQYPATATVTHSGSCFLYCGVEWASTATSCSLCLHTSMCMYTDTNVSPLSIYTGTMCL